MWFRQDLRVHDNEALTDAIKNAEEVVPIYVFDDRVFKAKSKYDFPKTGPFRAQFIIQAVENLRKNLKGLNLNLIVRCGKSEDIIFDLANEVKSSWIFCNRERTQEEVNVQDQLESKLWAIGQEIRYSRGKMLYHTGDLPFPVTHTPNVFTNFRKEVEKFVTIRKPLSIPERASSMVSVELDQGEIPSITDFGFSASDIEQIKCVGGEDAALERLNYYLWDSDLIASYKKTRNGMLGNDFSSQLSPYLAQGCISAKRIHAEVKLYERKRKKNESTYWLIFELLWRDFFRFIAKKDGNAIFQKGGTKGKPRTDLTDNMIFFRNWQEGRTGFPLIDANMIELNTTGFMSNRGRQNVASFLINDLKVNWQMGADYFESMLIDYDPASNWGNWNYIAGVGSDPRSDRYFNIPFQSKKYDAQAKYVKYWIPALDVLPSHLALEPYNITSTETKELDFILERDYHKPIVKIRES